MGCTVMVHRLAGSGGHGEGRVTGATHTNMRKRCVNARIRGHTGVMTVNPGDMTIDAAMAAANVMLRVAAQSVVEVEDRVTTPQLRVLMLVEMSGPQSLTDVATELGVHASNATRTCDKLVRAGLITRSEDPNDRRYARIDLTGSGRGLVEHVLGRRRHAMAEVLGHLAEPDRHAVGAALRTFAEAAEGRPIMDGRFTFGPPL